MIRKIIHIDAKKCNGCGLCVNACHEGAIGMEGGKATLLRDDYCDGLGDCLPACPTGAITFEEREAADYDEAAVQARMDTVAVQARMSEVAAKAPLPCGCPGSNARALRPLPCPATIPGPASAHASPPAGSQLAQWPVQIKLVPANAPYLEGAHLLIAADCAAYAYGNFHHDFMRNKVTLIGCPKLDAGDYADKLTEILQHNSLKSVTLARMEVPCCGGLESALKNALARSGKRVPWTVVTISTNGTILEA